MIFDVDKDEVTHLKKIYDATGAELKYVKRCDTETGEVVQIAHGPDGQMLLNETGDDILLITTKYPAPLTWVELGESMYRRTPVTQK